MTKQKRGLLGYTPIGFVVSTAVKAVGDNMSLQDAVLEAELLDSQTKERLGALIDQKGATSWDRIEETLNFYAQRFRSRLDAELGK
jgi:hypothetical protein